MKRTILTLTIVIASSVCSQSYGFDLLDRMLGMKGCGNASSCCEAPTCCEPACGAESTCCEPACGAESTCCGDNLCGSACEPACGAESTCCGNNLFGPACGAETACCEPSCCDSGCAKKSGCAGGLLGKLFGKNKHNNCCDAASCCESACQPACGCENSCCESAGCDSCFGSRKKGGLLSKLFKKRGCFDKGCDSYSTCDNGCGCGTQMMSVPSAAPSQAPTYHETAPMPPAPIVDPSASISRTRRVIQASASYVR